MALAERPVRRFGRAYALPPRASHRERKPTERHPKATRAHPLRHPEGTARTSAAPEADAKRPSPHRSRALVRSATREHPLRPRKDANALRHIEHACVRSATRGTRCGPGSVTQTPFAQRTRACVRSATRCRSPPAHRAHRSSLASPARSRPPRPPRPPLPLPLRSRSRSRSARTVLLPLPLRSAVPHHPPIPPHNPLPLRARLVSAPPPLIFFPMPAAAAACALRHRPRRARRSTFARDGTAIGGLPPRAGWTHHGAHPGTAVGHGPCRSPSAWRRWSCSRAARRAIVATRDARAHGRCLSNVCTHRGNVVSTAAGAASSLRCRYHGRELRAWTVASRTWRVEQAQGFPSRPPMTPSRAHGQRGPLLFARRDSRR